MWSKPDVDEPSYIIYGWESGEAKGFWSNIFDLHPGVYKYQNRINLGSTSVIIVIKIVK